MTIQRNTPKQRYRIMWADWAERGFYLQPLFPYNGYDFIKKLYDEERERLIKACMGL